MTLDHPKVRQSTQCPVCRNHKDVGLVVCWACYRQQNLKYGNPVCERIIDECERALA